MKQIPNIFTLLNLFFGCLAIVFTLQNGITILNSPEGPRLIDMTEQIWLSSLFIGLAAVVDFLDGFVARLFRATSELGKQLDSLADVVSFGVAPGMILYQFLRLSVAQEPDGLDASLIWVLPAFIVPCAAAYRLGKFNIASDQVYGFKGVPTPAVGLLIASLPLIYWNVDRELLLNKWMLLSLIAVVSYLMVSNLPMISLKFKSYGIKENLPTYLLLVIGILAVVLLQWLAVPVIFVAYVLVSLLFKTKTA